MGNSADTRANLLAKHWTQINPSTYKNSITEELIDAHQLHARNDEQLAYNNNLLSKRAAINHPNVIKLIYFYQQPPCNHLCTDRVFRHRIFTEHVSGTLASLLGSSALETGSCFCCAMMSGIGCLVERYGYFGISPTTVFFVNSVGLSKRDQNKIVKVWVNQDVRINHTQLICNQQEMCFQLYELYFLLAQSGFCYKIDLKSLRISSNFKDFFEQIYNMHKTALLPQFQVLRKRISSQLSNFQASKIQNNVVFSRQNQNAVPFNKKKAVTIPTNYSSRQSLLHRVNNSFCNFVQNDHSHKLIRQQEAADSKINAIDNSKRSVSNLFFRRQKTVKQVDFQQSNYQIHAKNKVNFSYTDSMATSKQKKSIQNIETSKFHDSPHQQLAFIYFPPLNHQQPLIRPMNIKQKQILPNHEISHFSSNSVVQNQKAAVKTFQPLDPQKGYINQQRQRFLKESFQAKNLQIYQQKVLSQPYGLAVNNSMTSSVEQKKETKAKAQANLKLQKCVDMRLYSPIEASAKSSDQKKQKHANNFAIINEYRFSFQPDVKIPSINISQSQEFSQESLQKLSGQLLREKIGNLPSKFYVQSHPQIGQSFQGKKFASSAEILVSPPLLKTVSESIDSLPDPKPTLEKKHNYSQKLQHFTKGIANSINSSGTKRSFPAKSQASQDMPIVHQNQLGDYQKKEQFTEANNSNTAHYGQRQFKNNRGSELESYYTESDSTEQRKKVQILQKINNTQKILQANKKKLQKLQLQKDLEKEKEMIKNEMESLLKNNQMADETHRIKEKVKHKKATFAELKAEASKILNDLSL